jgi:hypothetical protein
MKIYKTFIPLCTALFLSACSSNYLMTVNSINTSKEKDQGTFLYTNDTVAIQYSFAGRDGKVYVKVENKLDHPIIWNLKNSALVINGKALSYSDNEIDLKGKVGQTVSAFNEGVIHGYFNGTATLPKDVLLIPPHAFVDGRFFDLRDDVKKSVSEAKKERVVRYGMNGGTYKIQQAKFNIDDSPYILSSFLSYSVMNNGEVTFRTTEQKFYAETLFQTGTSLNNVLEYYTKQGDLMAYKKIKGENALLIGGVVALGAAAGALDNSRTD